MKIIEVFNQKERVGAKKYNFIVKQGYPENWFRSKRTLPKFYEIRENGKIILHTSLYQTYYAYKKRILGN